MVHTHPPGQATQYYVLESLRDLLVTPAPPKVENACTPFAADEQAAATELAVHDRWHVLLLIQSCLGPAY
jgi:hypothetical protein